MKYGDYIPERGDIVWLDFDPQSGHEQKGKRPALILSPQKYNEKTSLCICLPITSKIKNYPFEVLLPDKLPVKGVVLSDQIKSLDFDARNIKFACKAPLYILETVIKNVMLLIDCKIFLPHH